MADLDLWMNDEAICPHCGKVIDTTDMMIDGAFNANNLAKGVECYECGKFADIEIDFDVKFTTAKARIEGEE